MVLNRVNSRGNVPGAVVESYVGYTESVSLTGEGSLIMSNFEHEYTTQPEMWRRAAELASTVTLFPPGARVAFVGCGTSLYVAQAAAAYRNEQMIGESDAFPASEVPPGRRYDTVVVISRSGTTTEVLDATAALAPYTRILAITAVDDSPLARLVADRIVLSFADERSIVQTRFATSTLSLLLASCGWDVGASATRAEVFLGEPPEDVEAADHFVFLGRGVGAALANEAALKMREVLSVWTESYPTMEYRHGPISAASERSLVWILDNAEPSIDDEIAVTGARVVRSGSDPLAGLVRVHRAVQQLATRRGIDPDHPRFLVRSIMLDRR